MALTDNLVSYWKLDESSGNAADSVGPNTLTNNTSCAYGTGKINNGLAPVTGKYIGITDAAQSGLDILGNLSISAWVKFTSTPGTGDWCTITGKWGGTGVDRAYGFVLYNDGGLKLGMIKDNTFYGNAWVPSTGIFYHVVMVYTAAAGSLDLYVNGSALGAQKTGLGTSIANSSKGFGVGANTDVGGDENFNGIIDEVGIWSRVLSAAEITSLYNGGAGLQYPFAPPAVAKSRGFIF